MSQKHGYQPIHEPQRHVSQEEMWAKLAKHSAPKVEIQIPKVGETPKAQLQWLDPVKTGPQSGYVETACGLWSVTKEGKGLYFAWKRPNTDLGTAATVDDGKAICQAAS